MVCFVDAAHFVHGAFLGYLWCFTRLLIRGPSGRKRFNVLGAIDAVTHELTTVVNDTVINAMAVCELLGKLSARYAGLPVTLVLDNARYQQCEVVRSLAAELGIELLYLPSYSPNLNLIERLWKFVKKEVLTVPVLRGLRPVQGGDRGVPGGSRGQAQGRRSLPC